MAEARLKVAGGAIGTFTNPNQLGYWALASAASYLVLLRGRRLGEWDFGVLGCAFWLAAVSLSRAAIVGFLVLIPFGILFQGLRRKTSILSAGVAIGIATFYFMQAGPSRGFFGEKVSEGSFVETVVAELNRRTSHDSLEGRGYDRIWRFSEYLWFGAGQGGHERFTRGVGNRDQEIHSSFAMLLFCYGLVGLVIFSAFVVALLWRMNWKITAYAVPVILYGLAHNGLRFSPFWIFLALAYSGLEPTVKRRAEARVVAVGKGTSVRSHLLAGVERRCRSDRRPRRAAIVVSELSKKTGGSFGLAGHETRSTAGGLGLLDSNGGRCGGSFRAVPPRKDARQAGRREPDCVERAEQVQ